KFLFAVSYVIKNDIRPIRQYTDRSFCFHSDSFTGHKQLDEVIIQYSSLCCIRGSLFAGNNGILTEGTAASQADHSMIVAYDSKTAVKDTVVKMNIAAQII